MTTTPLASRDARAFIALQHVLPQHCCRAIIVGSTRVEIRRLAQEPADPRVPEALRRRPQRGRERGSGLLREFNAFFTRALRAGARPLDAATERLACPVRRHRQPARPHRRRAAAAGQGPCTYTPRPCSAATPRLRAEFDGGEFATIYLAPYNYHRIHMPLTGRLRAAWYVPGATCSASMPRPRPACRACSRATSASSACSTRTAGPMALVMVGALNVGSMSLVWPGDVTPTSPARVAALPTCPAQRRRARSAARRSAASTWARRSSLLLPRGPRARCVARTLGTRARRRAHAASAHRRTTAAMTACDDWRPSAPRERAARTRAAHARAAARVLRGARRARGRDAAAVARGRDRRAPRVAAGAGRAAQAPRLPAHVARVRDEAAAGRGQRRHLPGLPRVPRRGARPRTTTPSSRWSSGIGSASTTAR